MQLSNILSIDDLKLEVRSGYVSVRSHPEFPELHILNYTPKAQYEQRWNDVTKKTRGLIWNQHTGEVVARPFEKFFNYGDPNGPVLGDDDMVGAYNKFDGSLGVGYRDPKGGFWIATRGSFTSDQAVHATRKTRLAHAQSASGPTFDDVTPLYEIIYPENRVVLDYGQRDILEPLAVVDIDSGSVPPEWHPGDLGRVSFADVKANLNRPNCEGWVCWTEDNIPVKVKQPDYLELHRAITGLSPRRVWEWLVAGEFDTRASDLPDEFQDWARNKAQELITKRDSIYETITQAADRASFLKSRREQAQYLQSHLPGDMVGFGFMQLDGKDVLSAIMQKSCKPTVGCPVWSTGTV